MSSASPKGQVILTVGDKAYPLRFTNNAQCDHLDSYGSSVEQDVAAMVTPGKGDARLTRRLLHTALAGGGSDIELRAVGDILDQADHAEVGRLLGEAMKVAFPALAKQAASDKPGKAKPGKT